MIRFLAFIWFVLGTSLFFISGVFAFLAYKTIAFFCRNKAQRAEFTHQYSRYWAAFLFFFYGIRFKAHAQEKVQSGGPFIIVSNHQSQLDIPASALAFPKPFLFLAKKELEKVPVLGHIIKMIYLTVDRKSRHQREFKAKTANVLKNNQSILIFPEGTRKRNPEIILNPFYNGAFKLAIENQTPIAVLTIVQSGQLAPANAPLLFPGKLDAYWEEVIDTQGLGRGDLDSLKERVFELMSNRLKNNG